MKKIYLFAVIFALIAGFATYFFVNSLQHNSAVTGVEEADVVIALQDIEEDTIVTPDMFKVVRLPVSSITYGTLTNAAEVGGFMVTGRICKGEQVLASKLTKLGEDSEQSAGSGFYRLSYHLEDGNYAYTIEVASTNSVANFVKNGDYIDIYDQQNGEGSGPVLKKVKILKVGTYSDNQMQASGVETTTYSLITLSLSEKQIQKLIPIESRNNIRIALIPYTEGAEITTLPEETVTDENGEPVSGKFAEPATNLGMGEIQTDPPSTTAAE